MTGRGMVGYQDSSFAGAAQLDKFIGDLLEHSFRGINRADMLARLDIDHASSELEPYLREQASGNRDQYRIEFILEDNGEQLKFGTGHVFPLSWIRAPLVTLEYVLTYAAVHEQCRRNGEPLPEDAQESMAKVRALFDGQDIYPPDTDDYLQLANRFYEDRPWFYRLSTLFEVF